jgi:4-amino-4-deoxy-L-arabinose transferase-like glycosyltransferase
MTQRLYLLLFVVLLLVVVALRWHNLLALPAYIDEGYHTYHASRIWRLPEHPARFADGKLMLYFWLGMFTDANPQHNLFAVRASMSLIAVVTASVLALWTRQIANRATSLLAIGLYAVLPYTLFYERMAMSDPLASCLAVLFAWRCWVLAKRPTVRQGIIVGALFALVTLTKLSLATLGALIPLAIILWGNWRRWTRYVVLFAVTIVVTLIAWSPMAIPIVLSQNSQNPMTFVDPIVFAENPDRLGYFQEVLPEIINLLPMVWVMVAMMGLVALATRQRWRMGIFLAVWVLLVFIPPILSASIAASRYFMPVSAPIILLGAYGVFMLSRLPKVGAIIAVAIIGILGVTILPISVGIIQDPLAVELSFRNRLEFQSFSISQDSASLRVVNDLAQDDLPVFATWWACYVNYFAFDRQPICLDRPPKVAQILPLLQANLAIGDEAYWVQQQHGRDDFLLFVDYTWTFVGEYPRDISADSFIFVWHIRRNK